MSEGTTSTMPPTPAPTEAAVTVDTKGKKQETAPATDAAAPSKPAAVSRDTIARVEAEIEGRVQLALDAHDPWRLVIPIHQMHGAAEADIAKLCTKERHICDLDSDRMCIGCALYKQIFKVHGVFGASSRADMCDVVSMIMRAISSPFIADGKWLEAMDAFEGEWFIQFPVTVLPQHRASSIIPGPYMTIKRNRVRVYEARALLERLGLSEYSSFIYRRLASRCSTSKGGHIYYISDLLDELVPLYAPLEGITKLGIPIARESPRDAGDDGFDLGDNTPLAKMSRSIMALITELRG